MPKSGSHRLQFMERSLQALQSRNLYRELRPVESGSESWTVLNGKRLLNLSSNNYLGLANHPDLKAAATHATETYGCSAGASRNVSGTSPLHVELETRLAAFKGTEAALLFSSGYMANVGVIQALVGNGDLVLGDELNHASLIDGCKLSGAEYKTYPHCDMAALQKLLADSNHRRRLVVTDTIFSMDGDIAPLTAIAELCDEYNALLMVDEAHATGCYGPGGRGVVAALGLEDQVTISVGTLSKAFGGVGAFVAGSTLVKHYLINTARTFIFTTALPPSVIASAIAALNVTERDPTLIDQLQANATFLRSGLQAMGFDTLQSDTQIIPVLIGESGTTLEMAAALREEGVFGVAIRPPTVPLGCARIRLSVMASHTQNDLNFTLEAFERVGKRFKLL